MGYCNSEFIKHFLLALLGAFIFWHAMALFFDIIDSPPTSIFLWILFGFIFGVVAIDKQLKKDPGILKP
jgi:divalent metal cation (Fe/Co/Zn/Cd) transporter